MPQGKTKHYDDDRLVALLAEGIHSYAEIGRVVGLSAQHVGRIAAGRRRPDLQPLIHAATCTAMEQCRRLAMSFSRLLVARHIAVGLTEDGELGRLCREFVMLRIGLAQDR